jgi:hypothetical protein
MSGAYETSALVHEMREHAVVEHVGSEEERESHSDVGYSISQEDGHFCGTVKMNSGTTLTHAFQYKTRSTHYKKTLLIQYRRRARRGRQQVPTRYSAPCYCYVTLPSRPIRVMLR